MTKINRAREFLYKLYPEKTRDIFSMNHRNFWALYRRKRNEKDLKEKLDLKAVS